MEIQTQELLKTLSNKTNLEIINLLKNEPTYPRKISEILGMQEAYISRVLSQLEKLGILRSRWVYRERNVKLYSVDTKEINIAFEPEGMKIHIRTKGGKDISIAYDAFTFEIPEIHEFVGRERETKLLERSPVIVIEGIAGIGKTYLAAMYVEKAQKEGKKIFWHTFTEIDSFHYLINKLSVFLNNVGYSNLLEYVKLEGKDERVLISLVQQGISDDMVLCFDGFHQVRDRKIIALFRLLKNQEGKIIITSRERPPFLTISRTDITVIRLSALNERETQAFLRSRGVLLDNGILKKAHHRMGGHPLILDMFCEATREKPVADVVESLPLERVEDYLWSEIFEKLSEEDRELIEWLSIFRLPASTDVLKKIYRLKGFWTVLKGLEKRLLIKRQDSGYVLPSMIREFTYERVLNKEEFHKEIATSYLEEGTPEGLLEAMYHLLQAGELEKAAEGVVKSGEMDLIERGYLTPYMEILTCFSPAEVSPDSWCSITYAKGRIQVQYGNLKKAFEEFNEVLRIAKEIDSEKDYAKALYQIGNLYALHGEWKKAHDYFEEALHLMENLGNHQEIVYVHADIGFLLMKQNRFKEALSHFESGRTLAEKIGYKSGVCRILRRIGNTYYYQDEFDTALQYYHESLTMAVDSHDVMETAANYNDLGLVYLSKGEFDEALKYFEKDMKIWERISDIKAKTSSYANFGMVYAEMGEIEKALPYYEQVRELAEEMEDPYVSTYSKMKIAHLLLKKGEVEKAKTLCQECLEIFEQLGESLYYGEFCRVYGMILLEMGEWEKARGFFERCIEESADKPLDLGKAYLEYSLGLKKVKDEEATQFYERALALFENVSAQKEIEKARKRWVQV